MHARPIVDVAEDESDQRGLKVSVFIEDGRQAANKRDIACTKEWRCAYIRHSQAHPHHVLAESLGCARLQ